MAELGVYYITVLPSMKGFSSAVNKELGGLGKSGGRDYSGGFMSVLKGSAIGTVLGNLATKAGSSIMGGLQTGIGRLDTIKNFPRVMKSLGFETKDADKSVRLIMDHLDGLPTATQDIVTFTQSIADSTGDLDLATRAALGFNDMMLASGASAGEVTQAQGVLNRVLGKGNATVAQWQSLQSVMPAQLSAVAKELLGQSGSVEELRDKLNDGVISWDDFLRAVVKLDQEGTGAMASFETQARANSDGIGTALANIPNRIGAGWADVIEAIGREDISKTINTMSYGVRDAMSRIGEKIKDLKEQVGETSIWQNLQTIMGGVSEALGGFAETVSGGVNAAIPIIVDLVDDALQWIVDHGEQLKGIADGIGSGFSAIADPIGNALKDALPVAEQTVSDVFEWLLEHGEELATVLGAIAGAFGGMAVAIAADAAIAGIATSLGALGAVLPMVSGIADIPAAFALVAETGGPLAGLFGGISGALGFLSVGAAPLAIGAIAAIIGILAAWILTTEDGQKAWEDFCGGVSGLIEGLKQDFENGFNQIKQNLDDNAVQWEQFKTNIATWNEEMRQSFENFCNDVKSKIKTDINTGLDDFKKNWEDSCKKVATWNEEMRQKVLEKWDDIKRGVKEKFQAAYDSMEKIVEKIKGLFDFEWELPEIKLPEIELPTFSWSESDGNGNYTTTSYQPQWYAHGGVFNSARIIGIGEAGREAALPLNDTTYREIADGINKFDGTAGETAPTVLVTGNNFYVREDDDIDRIADAVALRTKREREGRL